MSVSITGRAAPTGPSSRRTDADLPVAARYGLSVLMVVVAILLTFAVRHLLSAPNLTLIFVLPVVVAAARFGWGPALVAILGGVLAFDFFFTEPYYSLRIASPSDVWAAGLLLAIAAMVSAVAAAAHRRAIEATRAAEQAWALQTLAYAVVEAKPQQEVLEAVAEALHRLFRAPSVVFLEDEGGLKPVATAGAANITPADEEAARGALETHLATRSETYPYDQSEFDFWPVTTPAPCRCVVGVAFTKADGERPAEPERFLDLVRGYLAAALASARG